MITIKRIRPGSAAKVGAIVSLISAAILNLIALGLQALFINAITNMIMMDSAGNSGNFQSYSGGFAAFGLVTMCIFYFISLVFAAIMGGIGGLVLAFAYNLAANWVGGLEIEMDEPPSKAKRQSVLDDIYE